MSAGRPFIIVTVLFDGTARPSAVTRALGDAMDRALKATAGADIAGIDLAELAIAPKAFQNVRASLSLADDQAAIYDVFPVSEKLDAGTRRVAGQFLAAEALWMLESQGMLKGAPAAEKLDLPKGWPKDPAQIRQRLLDAGSHELSEAGIATFRAVKARWDA